MLTGTRDYFLIAGGHATYEELKRVFGVMDAAVRVGFYEHDYEHGWNQPRREATTRWLMKWLQGKDDEGKEGDIKPEPEKLLNATPTGQVSTSFGGQTTRRINAALARSIFPHRAAAAIKEPEKLRALIGRVLNVGARPGQPVVSEEDGKLSIEVAPGLHIAATLSGAASSGKRPVIYVNSAGKSQDAGAIQKLVEAAKRGARARPARMGRERSRRRRRGAIRWSRNSHGARCCQATRSSGCRLSTRSAVSITFQACREWTLRESASGRSAAAKWRRSSRRHWSPGSPQWRQRARSNRTWRSWRPILTRHRRVC
jgi:hypothetical protein